MNASNLAIARARTNLKGAFMVHAANLRCSKIVRSDPAYVRAYTLGERRRRAAEAQALAAAARRRAKRALRHLRLTIQWAATLNTGVSS